MRYTFQLTLLLLATFGSLFSYAQTTPQQAIAQMGRGINLGNTLDDPLGYGKTWGNLAKEELFESYATAGFTCVRIPITWNAHTGTEAPYTVDETFLDHVEEVVAWAQERNLWVIINSHHEDWLFEDPSQENFDRLDSIWSQVAMRFKDHSDSLVFEILNEPRTVDDALTQTQVDDLQFRILDIIRETNPTRKVIIGGMGWANKADLVKMKIPEDDYIIGYFHSYDPWDFAGEGNGSWGTTSDVNQLKSEFEVVADWSAENNVPVLLGEFGARTRADFNDRMYWYAMYVETALENGFAFTTWDDNGWFQVLKRSSLTWTTPKDILVNFSSENPSELKLNNYNADSIKIEWTNRVEDYDSIYIQRGITSTSFENIATVDEGVSAFVDKDLVQKKTYYYRVVAVQNGTTLLMSYPQQIKADFTPETALKSFSSEFSLYPNPTKDLIYLEKTVASIEVNLLNGDSVARFKDANTVDLSLVKAGIYILKIELLNGDIYREKIIKQ